MKNLKKIVVGVLALVLALTLVGCKRKLDGVNTRMVITARRDKISVVAEFVDSDERIFDSITPTVYLYEMDGNKEGDEVSSKSMSISEGTDVGINTTSSEVVFEDLEEETSYKVVLKATSDGYSYELDSQIVTTNDLGSSEETAIPISSVEEFLDIRYDRDGYFKLTSDIDFNGDGTEPYDLTAMFTSSSNSFNGQIDGDNHTISGFKIVSNNQYNGLVGYNDGVIKNLNIEDASIETNRTSEVNTGLIAGYNNGTISNCKINNSQVIVKSTAYSLTYPLYAGMITGTVAGDSTNISVDNCEVTNSKIEVSAVHRATVGGLIGRVVAPKTIRLGQTIENNIIKDSEVIVSQENKTTTSNDIILNVGGFVGSTARTISNGIANVNITVRTKKSDNATYEKGLKVYTLNVGGFAGETLANSRGVSLNNVAFDGSILIEGNKINDTDLTTNAAYETNVGGLIGAMNGIIVKNGVVRLNELTIKAIEKLPEATEEGEKLPTYSVKYGMIIGIPNTDLVYVANEDESQSGKINLINVINLSNPATKTTVTGVESIISETASNPSESLNGFDKFISDYFNK